MLPKPNVYQTADAKKASVEFDNAGFGSIAFVMKRIIARILIISLLLKIGNPVKHGYVDRVQDWRYSSFHRFVAEGLLPIDWGD